MHSPLVEKYHIRLCHWLLQCCGQCFVANVVFCWQFFACNRRIPTLAQQQIGCGGSSEWTFWRGLCNDGPYSDVDTSFWLLFGRLHILPGRLLSVFGTILGYNSFVYEAILGHLLLEARTQFRIGSATSPEAVSAELNWNSPFPKTDLEAVHRQCLTYGALKSDFGWKWAPHCYQWHLHEPWKLSE